MKKMCLWCAVSFGFFFGSLFTLFTIGCSDGGTAAVAETIVNAIDVVFDNSSNDLNSTDVQSAIEELNQKIAALESAADTLALTTGNLETDVDDLKTKTASMSVSGNDIYFTGVNVNIRNGEAQTNSNNTLGNLIIGYNENLASIGYYDKDRSGSHNLVVGKFHGYSSYGGIVAGANNTITGQYASVTGGDGCLAEGDHSSVSGGKDNEAVGHYSSVSGGGANTAEGNYSSISGGTNQTVSSENGYAP